MNGKAFLDLEQAFELVDSFVQKRYIGELHSYPILPPAQQSLTAHKAVRLLKITRIMYDKDEDTLRKLNNVYSALGSYACSTILLLHSDGKGVNFYVGTRATGDKSVSAARHILEKAVRGNFPGTELSNLTNTQLTELLELVLPPSTEDISITAVSGVPARKNDGQESFVQGLEKLIDALQGEKYSAVIIADPLDRSTIQSIRRGYEHLYSSLSPFAKTQISWTQNESQASTEGVTEGFTKTISNSINLTQGYTRSSSHTTSTADSDSTSKSLAGLGALAAGALGGLAAGAAGVVVGGGLGGAIGQALLGSRTKGVTTTTSNAASDSDTYNEGTTEGTSEATSSQTSTNETFTTGSGKSVQMEYHNKSVANMLEILDEQIKRIRHCEDFGMWNWACYFITDDVHTGKVAASNLSALIKGQNSAVEQAHITTWYSRNDQTNTAHLVDYLRAFSHPIIELDDARLQALPAITPGSLVSGAELPLALNWPTRSVNGLPVLHSTAFGRNIHKHRRGMTTGLPNLPLGRIFHMGDTDSLPVELDRDSLTMHTFITGSTGSGKSNTSFIMLKRLVDQDIPFLVVEPAKGEYKAIFGGRADVRVFGTNPYYTELLQINPFEFPQGVHVLEHIDRLIEVFNAAWPMYAAMPAVLKEGIERAYQSVGWNLSVSRCMRRESAFPTFEDLLQELPIIMDESAYSDEVKGNYTGALLTRVKSMTNGLAGQIFNGEETDAEALFDANCIVDISRVGSMETKALIMGILLLRLQEHRQTQAALGHNKLKHITVLEEAHHLLRRTSFEQSSENANLQGKAVEMLSNAIAEMRAYGEGFIIVDQAPGLLDPAAIRNTNTKIILRLPEFEDRQIVGRAANLNEDQIDELSRLQTGVAAVYQNNWLEPVLCAIDEHTEFLPLRYTPGKLPGEGSQSLGSNLILLLAQGRVGERNKVDVSQVELERVTGWVEKKRPTPPHLDLLQQSLREYAGTGSMALWNQERFGELSAIIAHFLDGQTLIRGAKAAPSWERWNQRMFEAIEFSLGRSVEPELGLALTQCLLYNQVCNEPEFGSFYRQWVERARGGSFL